MLIILLRLPNFSTGGFPEKSRLPNCLLNNLFTRRFVIVNLRRKIRFQRKADMKTLSYCFGLYIRFFRWFIIILYGRLLYSKRKQSQVLYTPLSMWVICG